MYPLWLHSFFVLRQTIDSKHPLFTPVQELRYHALTEKIIGCTMKVHRYFGPVFPEIVYKRALIIDLKNWSVL